MNVILGFLIVIGASLFFIIPITIASRQDIEGKIEDYWLALAEKYQLQSVKKKWDFLLGFSPVLKGVIEGHKVTIKFSNETFTCNIQLSTGQKK